MSRFDNRTYVILCCTAIDDECWCETDNYLDCKDNVRTSLDGSLVILRYEGDAPASLTDLVTNHAQGYPHNTYFTHDEIRQYLRDNPTVWTGPTE